MPLVRRRPYTARATQPQQPKHSRTYGAVTKGSYETRGSNIYNDGNTGCWCTYQSGTSPPGYQDKRNTGGISNYEQCACNPAAAPTAVPAGNNVGVSTTFPGDLAVTVNFTRVIASGEMVSASSGKAKVHENMPTLLELTAFSLSSSANY